MNTYKTLLIDDERLAREELKSMLSKFPEIEIIGEAKNGQEGIGIIEELQPDLIFLDINMPEMSGFDMLKKLEEIPNVIFVTAYDEFALKAFEVDALDYILKPVETNRLEDAIRKLNQKVAEDRDFGDENRQAIVPKKVLTLTDQVFIKDGEKCWFISLKDIRMLESDGNYVKVYFNKFRPLILRSLNSFEERLDPQFFFRANRKFIINTTWISHVENWFNGGLMVELKEGEKVEISRRQAIRLREMYGL